jgi:hypothetical protein
MSSASVQLDINIAQVAAQIDKNIKGYDRVITRAANMGINRTISSVESKAVKAIAAETGYKQKLVRENIRVKRSVTKTLTAIIEAPRKAAAINLIEFVRKNRQTPAFFRRRYKSKSRKRGYTKGQFKYKGVEANAWNNTKVYKGAFIGRDGKGQMKVFKRTGGQRSKPTLVNGPSIPSTFSQGVMIKYFEREAKHTFPREFNRAAAHLIRQLK